jgi:hypothetical protein
LRTGRQPCRDATPLIDPRLAANCPAPQLSKALLQYAEQAINAFAVKDNLNIMSERFTETLRAASEPGWSDAVGHRFVKDLFAGAVPDAVMARYLIQDHRFLDSFLTLLGAALATADVETLHDIAAARRRGVGRIGNCWRGRAPRVRR